MPSAVMSYFLVLLCSPCVFSTLSSDLLKKVDIKLGEMKAANAELTWIKMTCGSDQSINQSLLTQKLNELRVEWVQSKCLQLLSKNSNLSFYEQRAVKWLCSEMSSSKYESREISRCLVKLRTLYQNSKVLVDGQRLSMEPDLTKILKTSRDPKLLKFVWTQWMETIGPLAKPVFEKLVTLTNRVARRAGYSDAGAIWKEEIGMPDLESVIENLYLDVKPLYEQLHGYVRYQLRKFYGHHVVPEHGPIPSYLLGSMWAQNWEGILDIVYKATKRDRLPKLSTSTEELAHIADDFYNSIGFPKLPKKFWENSKFENVEGECHSTAINMFKEDDVRMIFCKSDPLDDFLAILHEMGHLHYYLQYQNQPNIFKNGANSAMHECVGDTISLAALSTIYRRQNEKKQKYSEQDGMRYLLLVGLRLIPQISFSIALEKWRWDLYAGRISPSNYNQHFWDKINLYQGVSPAAKRPSYSLDATSKYHVSANIPYIRYFLSTFCQIQVLESMCSDDDSKDLYQCDISGSEFKTHNLRQIMSLGSQIDFDSAMNLVTDSTLGSKSLLKFFKPLKKWLEAQIMKYDIPIGWI